MELLSAICFYDGEGMSTMELYLYMLNGEFYHRTAILNGEEMLNTEGKLEAKNYSEAIEEWNRKFYMVCVITHMREFYGLEPLSIKSLIPEFIGLENNKAKKYSVKNYLGETSEFYVKVFYKG